MVTSITRPRKSPRSGKAIEQQGINCVVLLGDYVDEFNEGTKRIIDSTLFLADWVKSRRNEGLTVNALMGDHNLPYAVDLRGPGYYQVKNSVAVPHHSSAQYKLHDIMREMIDAVAVIVKIGSGHVLVSSHAGFVELWSGKLGYQGIDDLVDKVNCLYDYSNMYRLSWAGPERGGFDLPSPAGRESMS